MSYAPSLRVTGRTLMVGLLGAATGAVVMLTGLPADLFGRVPVLSGSLRADSAEVAVIDGHTLRLQRTVVRLAQVTAPARGQSCAGPGGPYDCGAAAAAALAGLVQGHQIVCTLHGRDPAGLPEARCDAAGADLGRAVVAAGWARAEGPELTTLEERARAQRLGLWQGGAQPSF